MVPKGDHPKQLLRFIKSAATASNADAKIDAVQELLALLKRSRSRSDDFDFEDLIQIMDKKDQELFWKFTLDVLTPIIEIYCNAEEDENRFTLTLHDTLDYDTSMQFLDLTVYLTKIFISDANRVAPPSLLSCTMLLHNSLLLFRGTEGENLQRLISQVCETWWCGERPGGENLIACLLPYLIVQALDSTGRDADVKRLWAVRGGLLLLDWDDTDSEGLKMLILRTFLSPVFLKSETGRRFLSSVFGLHPSFSVAIRDLTKAQIPHARKSILNVYGDVYFRAWRTADGSILNEIENTILQPLMFACVHASMPSVFQASLSVLDAFHKHKKQKGVDSALLRLYDPILWRALKVANPTVRMQACIVLSHAFPLQNQEASVSALELVLQRQFDAFSLLMKDYDPRVRSTAGKEIGGILGEWWEAIPLNITRAYISTIVTELASDAASPIVRIGAIEGLIRLLDCMLSHAPLKSLLPSLKHLLHDVNSRVRISFVKLLHKVRIIGDFHFFKITPVADVLARLEADQKKVPAVSNALTKLLIGAYNHRGTKVSGDDQVARILTMARQNFGATRVFCKHMHRHTSPAAITKVLVMIYKYAIEGIEESARNASEALSDNIKNSKRNSRKRSEKSRIPEDLEVPSEINAEMRGNLLEIVADFWESISEKITAPALNTCRDLLASNISANSLKMVLKSYKNNFMIQSSALKIAGLVGSAQLPGLLETLIEDLVQLQLDADSTLFGPIVLLLCTWGEQRPLLALIIESLRANFRSQNSPSSSACKDCLAPQLALRILDFILSGGKEESAQVINARNKLFGDCRTVLKVREALEKSIDFVAMMISSCPKSNTECSSNESLENFTECNVALLENATTDSGNKFSSDISSHIYMMSIVEVYGKFEIYIASNDSKNNSTEAVMPSNPLEISSGTRYLMIWGTEALLPALGSHQKTISEGLFGVILVLSAEWLALGSGIAEISIRAETWGEQLLSILSKIPEHIGHPLLVPILCRLVYQLTLVETQGGHVGDALWQYLLHQFETSRDSSVRKLISAVTNLYSRRNCVDTLVMRMLHFISFNAMQIKMASVVECPQTLREPLSYEIFERLNLAFTFVALPKSAASLLFSILKSKLLTKSIIDLFVNGLQNMCDCSIKNYTVHMHIVGTIVEMEAIHVGSNFLSDLQLKLSNFVENYTPKLDDDSNLLVCFRGAAKGLIEMISSRKENQVINRGARNEHTIQVAA